ncbi:glycosyltransferase family 2 protein [Jannaschia ovalis]|uniref:Glycosyltransferase family 2 protein n=1 Tax=Jannaschia ovalis TaxID=3038773 RepID=A0ABY8LFN4_9RHOB|nr:glycosyltransferase family 2 protein [Jannaschia sp. GRR-S6-38]WGH78920.1 glycosyltransferase family 2 protein [Jannaschia sp. GRR-S6-38]
MNRPTRSELRAAPDTTVEPATILVAIPVLNEERFIARTLDMLLAGRKAMRDVQIVVSDGGSTDGTRRIVADYTRRHPNIALIDNPRRRQAAGVNRVVETCAVPAHRYLVRVDAHADYPPGYVLDVVASLIRHEADALATVMDSVGTTCFQRGAAWAVDTPLGSGGSAHRGGTRSGWVDHGHHAGFTLAIWRRAGGYDPDYAANQDAELDHRIRRSGGRIWLDGGIRMGYHMRPGLRSLAWQYWLYGRGRARTTFRHRALPKLRQLIPALAVLANLAAILLAPVLPVLLIIPAVYLAVLAATTLVLLARHRSPCALWAGPALLAMHMAWGAGFLWHALTRQGRAA